MTVKRAAEGDKIEQESARRSRRKLKTEKIEQQLRVISILDIIFGVVIILGGQWFFMSFFLLALRLSNFKLTAGVGNMIFVGALIAAAIIAVGCFEAFVGLRLLDLKPWVKSAQILIAILSLPFLFIGTMFGVYCLWVLFSTEAQELFGLRHEESPNLKS